MLPPIAIVLLIASAAAAVRRRRRRQRLPAQTAIVSPRKSTAIARDGAVRSVQAGELSISKESLERLWTPANLENLARTYWLFLSRVTLGLIRVIYGTNERAVILIGRPLTLLRFGAPEYTLEADRGTVRWQIRDGLLVARPGRGRGFLAIDVRREVDDASDIAKLRIEIEVANFYPAISAGFSMPAYRLTQAFVHVLVTHAFLRSLATLELAESKIGRLSEPETETDASVAESAVQP